MKHTSYDNKEFVLRNKMIELDMYIRKNIVSFIPAVDRDIRIRLLDELYNMISKLHYAIYNKGNIRIKYLTDIIVCITNIDYLFSYIKKYNNINKSKVDIALNKLLTVRNMVKGWKLTEESK